MMSRRVVSTSHFQALNLDQHVRRRREALFSSASHSSTSVVLVSERVSASFNAS